MPLNGQRSLFFSRILLGLALIAILSACTPDGENSLPPTLSGGSAAPSAAALAPTSSATPRQALSATHTPTPAVEEDLEAPPTPLPTLPETTVIQPANLSRLVELDRWGKGPIQSLAWSLSGGQLAVATTTGIYLYNAQDFQKYRYVDTGSLVADLDYRPQGSTLAAALADGRLLFLDGTSGDFLQQTQLPGALTSVAYNPDGKQVAVGSLDPRLGVQIWDISGKNLLHIMPGLATPNTLSFTRSGGLLASLFEDGVAVWDTATGQRTALLRRPGTVYPTSLAFHSRENKIVIGSDYGLDNSLDLYLLPHGGHLRILFGHKDAITSIAMRPDGSEFASSSSDGTIQFWNWSSLLRSTPLTPQSPAGPFDALVMAYDPAGRRLAYAGRSTLLVWDLARRQVVGSAEGHLAWDYAAALSPDGSQFAASPDGRSIEVWDVNLRQVLRRLTGSTGPVHGLAFSSTGFLLAAGGDNGSTAVWDLLSGEQLFQTPGDQPWAGAQVLFAPDGQSLAVANGSLLSVYSARRGESQSRVDCDAVITTLALSPSGDLLVSAHQDGSLQVRNFPQLTLISTLSSGWDWPAGQLAFSPDGRGVAAVQAARILSPGVMEAPRIQFWDLSSGLALEFDSSPGEVNRLVFSPDGQTLAAAGGEPNSTITLWDVNSGQWVHSLSGHTQPVFDLSFSPDGELLVSASRDGTLRRWGIPRP